MPPPVQDGKPDDWKIIYGSHEDSEDGLADGKTTLARTLSVPKSMCILSDTKNEISTVTELVSPKLKLPLLTNDTVERVFPVRSVLSFDSTPSSALQTPSLDKLESPISPFADAFRNNDAVGGIPAKSTKDARDRDSVSQPDRLFRMQQQKSDLTGVPPTSSTLSSDDHVDPSRQDGCLPNGPSEASNLPDQLKKTIRDGGRILSKDELSRGIQFSPEDEARLAIQPFGALIVVSEVENQFIVQVASDNVQNITGYSTDELLELESVLQILPVSERPIFLSHVELVLEDDYDAATCGPEVFSLSLFTPDGGTRHMWCTMHTSNAYKNYVICELEQNFKQEHSTQLQETEYRSQGAQSIIETSRDRFTEKVKPYGSVQDPNGNWMLRESELLNALPRVLRRLSNAQTLEELVQVTTSSLHELTHFHRVSLYHFDSDKNGIVVADEVDHSRGLQSYEGMHFDENTFPDDLKKQYLRSTVSFSYRRNKRASELVYRASMNQLALDLSHCYLGATSEASDDISRSPVYACVSIGIYVFGKLWGLVSCQSHDKAQILHPLVRRVCWLMREAISSNIERLSYSLPFQIQDNPLKDEKQDMKTPAGDLLGLFGADYAAASILDETKILGKPADSQEVLALLEYLRAKSLETILWSTELTADFGDLDYSPGFRHISGLLYVPLSADGNDFIIFFHGKKSLDYIPDRTSRQLEWSTAELGKASILSLMYRTFTEIWQEKEAAMQNNQLMRLLLANSAHEFRTPLNAIINYLEIALDGTLDQATRENLSRSHSASKSLVYIINDLLDLTNAENGQRLIKDEVFSLSDTLCEATDIFWEEARQKHVDLQVIQHSALPAVLGDQRRVRQVITNLISNAVQHTSSGAVTIESCILSESCEPREIAVEVAIHDTGSGMSQDTVETLFCELEQVSNKGYMQNPKSSGKHSSQSILETESVLGLGLALVARIVRNMNGQLSLKSEEGKGSCFKIRLKFPLPSELDETEFHSLARSNETEEGVAPSLIKCSEGNTPSANPKENGDIKNNKTSKEDEIVYRCGDDVEPGSGPGEENSTYLDVDVSLKTGESRSITIPTSTPSKRQETEPKDSEFQTGTTLQDPAPEDHEESKASRLKPQENKLRILVAEDDPINSTIMRKRLEKLGYSVRLTGNGKECASVYRESPHSFDAVLMDLQMPIVDGQNATKMIREDETQESSHGRIPVFAVSASLKESDRQSYIECGFDGWIMKPIDFQRVHDLLGGVKSSGNRNTCLYQPGMWEQGGWFEGLEV